MKNISYLTRIFLLAIYKNFGNVAFFVFIIWLARIADGYDYTFQEFLFVFCINMLWFLPLMLAFFVFRIHREIRKIA